MSRIHDALKKAEQERTAALVSQAPEALREGGVSLTEEARPAAPASPEPPLHPVKLTFEALLERCSRPAWHPNLQLLPLANPHHPSTGAEEFRMLRSRLYSLREKMPLKTVLLTSALPGDGKTFTAANLAQAFVRQHERRVLLIDADLRRSRMHTLLNTKNSPGLSDYLQGKADEFAVIQRSPQHDLFFIPGGSSAPNPSELLSSTRMKDLFARLSPLFDWIVLDSPPVLPVSDPAVLGAMCDGVLMVIRVGETPIPAVQRACSELQLQENNLLGVVLNCADSDPSYYEYYGYGYQGYQSANGSSNGKQPKANKK
jgi:protein-tyrosine kinase